jgi:solute carrier family 50 protein (sugar transporter)
MPPRRTKYIYLLSPDLLFLKTLLTLLAYEYEEIYLVQILTFKLLLLFNSFGFGLICVLTLFLTQGQKRVQVLGWICMIFSLCVFVAPLFIVVSNLSTQLKFQFWHIFFFLILD